MMHATVRVESIVQDVSFLHLECKSLVDELSYSVVVSHARHGVHHCFKIGQSTKGRSRRVMLTRDIHARRGVHRREE